MTKLAEILNKNGDFGDLRLHYSISQIGALQAKAGCYTINWDSFKFV